MFAVFNHHVVIIDAAVLFQYYCF